MTWVIPIWVKAINLQPVWEAIWCPCTDAACHNFTTNLKKKMSKFLVKSWKISCFWQQDYLFPDIFIPIFNFFIWYNFILKKIESIFHSIFFTILKTKLMSKFSLKWNLFRYLSWWQYWNARISFKKKNSRGFLIACWAIQVEMEFFFARDYLFVVTCSH